MGIVTQSIGTASRTFSTLQAWEDALPANLVTDGNSYIGECYNDSQFTGSTNGTNILLVSGETTDSTHTITLKCAAGQSFRDNAGVQTNPLRYDQSKGVGLSISNYSFGIKMSVSFVTIDGLQITLANNSGPAFDGAVNDLVVQNCLSQKLGGGPLSASYGRDRTIMRNNCIIHGGSGNCISLATNQGLGVWVNNTIVCPSDSASFGTKIAFFGGGGHYDGLNVAKNNAVFGFATFCDTLAAFSGGNNCTDLASTTVPGSSNQVSKTYANQFVSTVTATPDFRAKSGADLLNNAATDTTDVPSATDIAGTSRPQGAAWDIGAWELVAAAPPAISFGWQRLPVIAPKVAQAFPTQPTGFSVPPAIATTTGTLAAIETPDTASFTATYTAPPIIIPLPLLQDASVPGTRIVYYQSMFNVFPPLSLGGTLTVTEAPDIAAFNATFAITGILATTEGQDTASFTGSGVAPTGTLAVMEAPDTAAFIGNFVAIGTLAVTEAQDTGSFSGTVSLAATGTLAVTEAKDIASFTGTVVGLPVGILATTELPDNVIILADYQPSPTTTAPSPYPSPYDYGWYKGKPSMRKQWGRRR